MSRVGSSCFTGNNRKRVGKEKWRENVSGRSFDLVEDKLAEAEFFLQKMASAGPNVFEVRCYFSAFASAARSVTFTLQAVMSDVDGFVEWYAVKQEAIKRDALARFFVERRNESQKVGDTRINQGTFYYDEHGNAVARHFFAKAGPSDPFTSVEADVVTAAARYVDLLRPLVADCHERFAWDLDPDLFFTEEGLRSRGLTVEDVEEMMGLPRGWTNMIPDDERLRLLNDATPVQGVTWIIDEHIMHSLHDTGNGNG